MSNQKSRSSLGLWIAALMTTGLAAFPALAAPQDYRFEAVQPALKVGNKAVINVRLMHVPTGKPVTEAVIFQNKIEMPMQGMAPMAGAVKAAKPDGKGNYAFEADLSMEGEWVLALAAKVQGEAETVRGTVNLKATK